MIKRYNQFVEERINEELDIEEEIDTNEQESELAERDLEQELDEFEGEGEIEGDLDYDEEEQMEEEGGDIYAARLQEVADKLGCEVTGSKVMCDGKKIMFPSETEMYHVDNKKFKTADEVVEYLRGEGEGPSQPSPEEMEEMERVPHDAIRTEEEPSMELQESKSYRHTRKFK